MSLSLLSKMSNFSKYVNVTSVKEYFDLPLEKRTAWKFFYKKPIALPMDDLFGDVKTKKSEAGWNAWESRIKKEYPVQFFLRETLYDWWSYFFGQFGCITELKYKIRCLFKPYHSELRKIIPRRWSDITNIIPEFLLACIVSFVEKEDGLSQLRMMEEDLQKQRKLKSRKISKEERAELNKYFKENWQGVKHFNSYCDHRLSSYQKIQEIYKYAKEERPRYKSFLDEGKDYVNYDGTIIPWGDAEDFIDKKDTEYCRAIIDVLGHLWT